MRRTALSRGNISDTVENWCSSLTRSSIFPRDLPSEANVVARLRSPVTIGRFYRLTLFLAIRQTREFCGHRRRAESSLRELLFLRFLGEKSSGSDRPFALESDRNNDRQGERWLHWSNLGCFSRYWFEFRSFEEAWKLKFWNLFQRCWFWSKFFNDESSIYPWRIENEHFSRIWEVWKNLEICFDSSSLMFVWQVMIDRSNLSFVVGRSKNDFRMQELKALGEIRNLVRKVVLDQSLISFLW